MFSFVELWPYRRSAKQLLTKSQTLRAARLQYESGGSDEGQETARYDEVYDVVQWYATKM